MNTYRVFEDLKAVLQDYDLASVADAAECSQTTLYNWLSGQTRKPRIDTLTRVAEAVGYVIELRMVVAKPQLYAVK